MDWDKIAERLLTCCGKDCQPDTVSVAAKLREMGEEIERLKAEIEKWKSSQLWPEVLKEDAYIGEIDGLRAERDAALVKFSAADAMAKIVDDWVKRKTIDSRSELADARLDYGEPYRYEAKENTAYLKGLKEAQKITAKAKKLKGDS